MWASQFKTQDLSAVKLVNYVTVIFSKEFCQHKKRKPEQYNFRNEYCYILQNHFDAENIFNILTTHVLMWTFFWTHKIGKAQCHHHPSNNYSCMFATIFRRDVSPDKTKFNQPPTFFLINLLHQWFPKTFWTFQIM